ncbi:MAG: response regulator [Candidatus Hydrothermarchaeota archaeon]|nr:MAG: response regulator [Candidatus Hydrothermarchaeota archaeon]
MKGNPAIILLVEDNESHARLIIRTLEEARIMNKVFWVRDGLEALEFLHHKGKFRDREKFPTPDLILLDLKLPKLNGHEVLKEIKSSEELRVIPVVVLTASEDETDLIKAYLNYTNSYLVKPIEPENFRKMVEHLGFYWIIWNKSPRRR